MRMEMVGMGTETGMAEVTDRQVIQSKQMKMALAGFGILGVVLALGIGKEDKNKAWMEEWGRARRGQPQRETATWICSCAHELCFPR